MICPICSKEAELLHKEIVEQKWITILNNDGLHGIEYTEVYDEETIDVKGYYCSVCENLVCREPEEACKILKGEKK